MVKTVSIESSSEIAGKAVKRTAQQCEGLSKEKCKSHIVLR